MDHSKQANSLRGLVVVWSVFALLLVSWVSPLLGLSEKRPERFLPDELRIIREYYTRSSTHGLPPGLAKRGGNLPPGLQKHLQRNGTLPPGLQKRLEPLPTDLNRRLPGIPDDWSRVILGRDVLLIDRRTNRILDIIENVIGLVTER